MGDVMTYIQEKPWLQTMAEGYDSNGIGPLTESDQILAEVWYTLGYKRRRLTYKSMDMLGLRRTLTCM